jgi:hypothetical protein
LYQRSYCIVQIITATQRNDNKQPASATSVGCHPRTTIQASAKTLAGSTTRRRISAPHTAATCTADRAAGGRQPVRAAYATSTSATAHAPRFRRTPASRRTTHKNAAKTTRCCPEIASAWTTPVRTYFCHSSLFSAAVSPSKRAAATPACSGGSAASSSRRPQPRTAASHPAGAAAHPSASRTTPSEVL